MQRLVTGLAFGIVGIVAVTFVFAELLPVNPSTAGFFFLIVVLATATSSGFAAAGLVSIAATLCYNYFFLPPVGQFTIADPANWVALFTFLVTALVASHLSDRAQKQAEEARRSQRETERLYALSRAILLTDAKRPIATQAAQSIAEIFESPSVAIFDAEAAATYCGGRDGDETAVEPKLRRVVQQRVHERDDTQDLDIWPISLGGPPIGALSMTAFKASEGAAQSILNLVAIALERMRSEEAAHRAEAARQSEEFKSTLLDAIAHEFKTPLTSIKAAATGLRMAEVTDDQRELTSIITEETDRLSQLVTEAVKMAEIDAGKVTLHRAITPAGELVRAAVESFAGRGDEHIGIDLGELNDVDVDAGLIILALRQLIDNALKYSGPDTPVTCRAETEGEQVVIRVIDRGRGIPERDRERVFDKFYRRESVRKSVPGSGLGLHIAREIARIHGGDLWIDDAKTGCVFCLSLPTGGKQ